MSQDQMTEPLMYCLQCGYALHGLSENRCPECGLPFDPVDFHTFGVSPGRPGWWRRRRSPGLLHALFTLILTAFIVEPMTRPWGFGVIQSLLLPVYALAGLVLGMYYVVLAISAVVRMGRVASVRSVLPCRRGWYVLPVCALLVLLSAFTNVPLKVRFHLSRGALEAQAKAALAGTPVRTPTWIGLYRIETIVVDGSAVLFETGGGSLRSSDGFVYQCKPSEYLWCGDQITGPWSDGGIDPY